MKTKPVLFVLALVAGVALGWVIKPTPPAADPAPKQEKQSARKSSRGDDAALNRLRRRIEELERQLAAAASTSNAAVAVAIPQPEQPANTNNNPFLNFGRRHGPPSFSEMRKHLEELRKVDPDRYTQMTNNFARWRRNQIRQTNNQLNLLSTVDTEHMSKKQLAAHNRYQDLVARQSELREILNGENTSVTDEERDAAMKEMFENGHELRRLAGIERETLLEQTANALGYSGDEAAQVVDAIKAVYEATGSGGGRHGGHGGPPPPPPGGRR